MEQLQTTVTLLGIHKIVQQIVDRFCPQKVILFGSSRLRDTNRG